VATLRAPSGATPVGHPCSGKCADRRVLRTCDVARLLTLSQRLARRPVAQEVARPLVVAALASTLRTWACLGPQRCLSCGHYAPPVPAPPAARPLNLASCCEEHSALRARVQPEGAGDPEFSRPLLRRRSAQVSVLTRYGSQPHCFSEGVSQAPAHLSTTGAQSCWSWLHGYAL
jgi:hypothetical protein